MKLISTEYNGDFLKNLKSFFFSVIGEISSMHFSYARIVGHNFTFPGELFSLAYLIAL